MKKHIFSIAILLTAMAVHGQDFRTDQSVSAQLRNNSVPGLLYAPATTSSTKAVSKKTFQGSSLGNALKMGKESTMVFAPGTGSGTVNSVSRSKATNAQSSSLSSSLPATKEGLPAKPATLPPVTGQGDITSEQANAATATQIPPPAEPTKTKTAPAASNN